MINDEYFTLIQKLVFTPIHYTLFVTFARLNKIRL